MARRRADRHYRKLGRRGLLVIVPTFPGVWRHVAGVEHVRAWRARVRIVIRGWLEGELRAGVGALEYLHPAGDHGADSSGLGAQGPDRPESEEPQEIHPHLNYLIPLGMLSGGGGDSAGENPLRAVALRWPDCSAGWVPPEALERLKSALFEAYMDLADTWDLPHAEVNVFVEYRKGKAKVFHALRYFARPWPTWDTAMRQIGLGCRLWALSSGFAKTHPEEQRLLLRFLKPKKEPQKGEACPICGQEMEVHGPGTDWLPHEAGAMVAHPPTGPPGKAADKGWSSPAPGSIISAYGARVVASRPT